MSYFAPAPMTASQSFSPSRAQVQLVAPFGTPTRPRDDEGDAIQLRLRQMVVLEVEDVLAEQVHHYILRFRALQLERGDIRLPHDDIESGVDRDAFAPEEDVPIGEREPEVIFPEAEEDRVVDDAAVRSREEHILALPDRALLHVPRREHLHKLESVRAVDLDLPLHPRSE